jgi:hypothetical protein
MHRDRRINDHVLVKVVQRLVTNLRTSWTHGTRTSHSFAVFSSL